MNLLSFLFGLLIGGITLLLYRARLRRQLEGMLHSNMHHQSGFSLSNRLANLLTDVQQHRQKQQDEIRAWKNVINQGPMGYLLVDADNQMVDANQQALRLLNIQLDLKQYRTTDPRLLLELVRSYDLDQLIEKARDRQQLCQKDWRLYPISADVENITATTQQINHLRGYAFPLTNSHITVLLESRQEEVFLSQQRDRWASDVAHELKTPLTSIRLVAETLQTRVDPSLRQWVNRLLAEIIRLSTLVQEILDLSQLESRPDRALKFHSVDLAQMIRSAWHSLEPLAQDHNITLSYQGPNYLIIHADESRLFRVMLNLLDNSLKYSPDHQKIQVKVQLIESKLPTQSSSQTATNQRPSMIQIDLIDAGQGFPESDLPLIFERFYRGDPSRARNSSRNMEQHQPANTPHRHKRNSGIQTDNSGIQTGSGSGLGLAIVWQIIERHNGHITARNHPDTGGAWLQIKLPQQQIQ
ncbi:HAMP domain-containing histidine kinase [filamentous cyanobacterium LEGE 11480]|uniref:histidine kinase n=1 Tax=Romeriopsis navalis LEGE 11480 TaxID=2777977 RepID=A0A928VHU5_9CYAN|nr:HAMP domain-containing sensor histidine kinase [Romeriopsis navalis]MBE9028620.1 HAMP domain-containing histidine kinase [Romeriopsis navalis LEGE 11480]